MTEIEALMKRLTKVTDLWQAGEKTPPSEIQTAKEIGGELHALGGFNLMQDAYWNAHDRNPYAWRLDAYWDGIGEWMR